MRTFDLYRERREERFAEGADLEKLRLGQASCEIVDFVTDPEIRCALVPLTEGEYRRAMEAADKFTASDNRSGDLLRERVQQEQVLFYSARELENLGVRFFDDPVDVLELDEPDFVVMWDQYLEMVATASPTLMGMTEDDFEATKKALPRIAWSELSGRQWYAAQRFLNSIRPLLLTVNWSGSSQTRTSTPTSDEPENVRNAESDAPTDIAPTVEK